MVKMGANQAVFALLIYLAALGKLEISAGVSCSAAGESGGNCEPLQADSWCEVRLLPTAKICFNLHARAAAGVK